MMRKNRMLLTVAICMMAFMLHSVVGATMTAVYPGRTTLQSNDKASTNSVNWKIVCTSSSTTELYGAMSYRENSSNSQGTPYPWITADDAYCEGGRQYSRSAYAGARAYWRIQLSPAWNTPTGYADVYGVEAAT
nr:hypothetical protein [bacterium]